MLTVTKRFFDLFLIKDPVDPGKACPGPSGDITHYKISFQTKSFESVNIARCTARRCKHTFEPKTNLPTSYDSVSVAAENVVGVGAARTCTAQPISKLHLSLLQKQLHIILCYNLLFVLANTKSRN